MRWVRRGLAFLSFVAVCTPLPAAERPTAFYRVPGREVGLVLAPDVISVHFAFPEKATTSSGEELKLADAIVRTHRRPAGRDGTALDLTPLPDPKTARGTLAELRAAARLRQAEAVAALRQQQNVDWAYPAYRSVETGTLLLPTPDLLVALRPGATEHQLRQLQEAVVLERLPLTDRQYRLRLAQLDDDPIATANALTERHPWIEWAEPDFLQEIHFTSLPNDPNVGQSWHLKNTGQGAPPGVIGSDARLEQAWGYTTGNPTVVIAIIDDGVQRAHPDLAGNIYTNPNEIANGIDDDGNGFIDDLQGWDFFQNDNAPDPASGPASHGTAVAGVAAAVGNNGLGGSGACQHCRILPVRIGDNNGFVGDSAAANAINYAATKASVLNNSWIFGSVSAAIDAAIANAVTNGRGGKGSPVIFGNGNSASGYTNFSVVLNDQPSGTWGFEWRYVKNANVSAGFDTAWLDDVVLPDGTVFDFDSCTLPAGWTSSALNPWQIIQDETRSSSARTSGSCALKAGTITHNQSTSAFVTKVMDPGPGSTLTYRVWVSSERQGTADGTGQLTNSCFDGLQVFLSFNGSVVAGPIAPWCGTYSNSGGQLLDGVLTYPSSNPLTISVGGATNFDRRSDYAQWGTGIDFVAHTDGGSLGIFTTDVVGATGYSATDFTAGFGGTSSAAPLASGIAGLLLSREPGLTEAEVRTRLQQATRKIGSVPYVAGFNLQYGYGALDATLMMQANSGLFFDDDLETGNTLRWSGTTPP